MKYLLMTEAEFEALLAAAIGADINCPHDVAKIKEAEAACRARRVEEDALGNWVEVGK
jgi:hypothetical protein